MKLYLPDPVLYFFSVLYHQDFFSQTSLRDLLSSSFPDLKLNQNFFWPQDNPMCNYYSREMGQTPTQLKRFFCSTEVPAERERLVSIKLQTMKLETKQQADFRAVNIDPGYIAKEHLCLSSHKPYSHRFYLSQGIYAELEYLYRDGQWIDLPWTYPDYQDHEKKQYFIALRKLLL